MGNTNECVSEHQYVNVCIIAYPQSEYPGGLRGNNERVRYVLVERSLKYPK